MGKPIVYVVCCIFYDTTPFVRLFDCEVRVSAKGAEALEFLFREFGYVGGMWKVEREPLVRVMYCSRAGLEDKGGSNLIYSPNGCLGGNEIMFDSEGPGEPLEIRQ